MVVKRPRDKTALQRGRTQTSAESSLSSGRYTPGLKLQRGRTQTSAESPRPAHVTSTLNASTGPHSNECGKARGAREEMRHAALLQRGRTQTSAERTARRSRAPPDWQLQRGRTQTSAERAWIFRRLSPLTVRASTGPHSNECGKLPKLVQAAAKTALLQRGRTQTSAESGVAGRASWGGGTGFNGAALKRVRKGLIQVPAPPPPDQLQRGRTQTSAESRRAPVSPPRQPVIASTGPHSNECGKANSVATWPVSLALQRGRTQTSAESAPLPEPLRAGETGFNGAALKRVRKD